MKPVLQKHASKLRFAIVGIANTGIDFGILFGLVSLGFDKIPANLISTSLAFVFSFFANKSFTFRDPTKTTPRTFGLFIGVTLVGLWLIQPVIISLVYWSVADTSLSSSSSLLVAKLLATIVTLIWNYTLYSKLVFRHRPGDNEHKSDRGLAS